MSEKRVIVWTQHFPDRPHVMLQWHDPVTGKRKSRTAGTANPLEAEKKRAALEFELNHGLFREPARMPWETFRATFEDEYVSTLRPGSRECYANVLNLLERICAPRTLRAVDERMLSAFAAGLRKLPI